MGGPCVRVAPWGFTDVCVHPWGHAGCRRCDGEEGTAGDRPHSEIRQSGPQRVPTTSRSAVKFKALAAQTASARSVAVPSALPC